MRPITPFLAALALAAATAATADAQDTTRTRVSTGEVESRRVDNRGLGRALVERLQTRLRDMGCDPGPIDGLIGPRTRAGISCARQRENIPGDDIQELLRELNVTPTDRPAAQRDTTDTQRMRMRDTTMQHDPMRMRDTSRMQRRDTTRMRDTTHMPMRDTTRMRMRDTLRDTMPRRPPRDTLRDTIPPLPPRR